MSEIGETLQTARMRAALDIADIEAETKIRAKYLRALEQEDWGLLPGPTYVRSFLRTYADALGLDGRMMVEQYRLQHERPSDQDLLPIAPVGARRQDPRRSGPPRWAIVLLLVMLLVGALWWLGQGGESAEKSRPENRAVTQPVSGARTTERPTSAPERVSLRVRATGTLFVCIQDARGRIVVDGETLGAGEQTRKLRSTAFRVRLGNGDARLIVNGRSRAVADRSPQAYRVSSSGIRPVALDKSPSCAPG